MRAPRIAALIAISYAGFDITSLAIVAGALSVGIGFGLQSIVNNFVSGLILLVERPIKVGDWIVVGNEQGHVRRISVRATEIETFDRASLIVPNSELITGRVLNWTHRNLLGRVVLKVSVDHSADPEIVMRLLIECAAEHPSILKSPAPKAVFEGFGASTLDFSLRFLLGDLNRSLDVQSEMRAAILSALRTQGVSIAPTTAATGSVTSNAVSLKVGVAHASAPEQVIAILLKCADDHPQVLKTPEPKALLEKFGQSSLDFTLDFAVEDAAGRADVQSELRIAILNEFRSAWHRGAVRPARHPSARSGEAAGIPDAGSRGAARRRFKAGRAELKPRSVLAEDALAALVALLGLERERRDRTGIEAFQADGLAGLLAVAVGAVLDPCERGIDLGDQLALPVAGAQLECPVGLERGPVGDVGMLGGILV